ncbi:hypothetical protein Tco_0169324 [Tanacetum coccineum]
MVLKGIAKVDIGPCDVGLYGKVMVLFDGAEVEVRGTMNSDLAGKLGNVFLGKWADSWSRQKTKEEMERMIAKAILQESGNIQAEISSQIQKAIDNQIPSQVYASVRSYMSGYILHVYPAQSQTLSVPEQQYQLYLSMKDNPQLQQQDIAIWLALQMKFESLQGENRAKWQKTSEYEAYVSRESSSVYVNEEERGLLTSGNQEQVDDYDFWTDSMLDDEK